MTTIILCWNEIDLIAHTVKHYKQYGHVIVYDNHSTDGSDVLAAQHGAEVRKFGSNQLDDREYLNIKNKAYKGMNDDWICVVDADEFLYHPNLSQLLQDTQYTMFQIKGWNIYSEQFGQPFSITTGFWDANFNKSVIFNPSIDINYSYGAHTCNPKGKVIYHNEPLYLFHYRCMGGVQRMIDRHKAYAKRMCDFNRQHRLGGHYLRTGDEIKKEWQSNIKKCTPFVPIQ
jgi:glycosyltransferase involved in cell wall biosynthesis